MADRRATHDSPLSITVPPLGFRTLSSWRAEDMSDLAGLRHAVHDAVTADRSSRSSLHHLADRVTLLACELATNALRHGAAPTLVRLQTDDASLLVDVADHDLGSRPVLAGARPPGEGGYGMVIVCKLAREMGWYATSRTKHVWARVPA